MPLPSSGTISLNQIHVEAGGSSGTTASLNDSDIREMIGKSSGASNSFTDYYGVSAGTPTIQYRGAATTTANGFPNGYVTLTSGTKVVVVTLQLAGGPPYYGNTYVSLGGNTMTQASKIDTASSNTSIWQARYTAAVYYLQTSLSGSVYITGNGGSGRSNLYCYEIRDYNSATPYTTDTAQNTTVGYSAGITVANPYNGLTVGATITEDSFNTTSGISVTNVDQLYQQHLESASAHCSWYDTQTPLGNRTYTVTQTPGNNVVSGSTLIQMASATWK